MPQLLAGPRAVPSHTPAPCNALFLFHLVQHVLGLRAVQSHSLASPDKPDLRSSEAGARGPGAEPETSIPENINLAAVFTFPPHLACLLRDASFGRGFSPCLDPRSGSEASSTGVGQTLPVAQQSGRDGTRVRVRALGLMER
ncbi:hypothetical protein NDU88_000653 [Pleurodeles waltl]|uniref:Uncharacterized protein n=1 Tax=Pleurodeles waltl TaxID=8319 RepID=A0AAV7LVC6_PLEWA|nr:hypothetical protein NDU88_000653 [Pleurodeles waltl]